MKQEQGDKSNQAKQIDPHRQLQLLLQLQNFKEKLTPVKKTLILYDTYQSPEDISLSNLHALGLFFADTTLTPKVTKKNIKRISHYIYSVPQAQSSHISKIQFKLEKFTKSEQDSKERIGIYQAKNSDVRIVVLPFQKNIIDNNRAVEFHRNLEELYMIKQAADRKEGFQGQKLQEAQKKLADWKKDEINKFGIEQKQKFLTIFQLEAILQCCLSFTEKVSVGCLAELETGRFKNIRDYQKQLNTIFLIPSALSPQTIVHSLFFEDLEEADRKELQHESISAILTLSEEEQFSQRKLDCMNEDFFWKFPKKSEKQKYLRMNLFQNIRKSPVHNTSITSANQQFNINCKEITLQACSVIGHFLSKDISQLGYSLNSSQYCSLEQLEDQYKLTKMELPSLDVISPYLELGRQKKPFENLLLVNQEPIVPSSIESLTFAFFFERLSRQFLKNYASKQQECNREESILLKEWQNFFKEVLSLCLNFSSTTKLKTVRIQRCFDFISFLISSCILLIKVNGKEGGTCRSLKVMLEKLMPKRDFAFNQIKDNTQNIKKGESLNYYNILQEIIRDNYDQNRAYLHCYILELKAYCIASLYIADEKQIIQAIKSYAHICLQYPTLNKKKRQLINLLDLEKKMARLLMIVSQEQSAIEIYFKNRLIGMAQKACSFAKTKFLGNQKAKQLIKWGQKFQKELEYELAMSYYRDAYECAKTIEVAKDAISHKLKCNEQKKKEEPDNLTRDFYRFISSETTSLSEFTSVTDLAALYSKIKNELTWDEEGQIAIFVQKEGVQDLAMLSSIVQ